MYHRIIGTLLGAVLLGVQGSNAEWYKVSAGGQVTFTLTEHLASPRATSPNTFVLGNATILLEYVDGSAEQIACQESGSSNVTLTGGIVALWKNGSPPSTSSAWSPGLKSIPDYALLSGEKIPPLAPNIIDVRIVRQEVTADFP
jgi:hypothetical protein